MIFPFDIKMRELDIDKAEIEQPSETRGNMNTVMGDTMNRCYDCHSQNCHQLTLV